MDLVRTSYRPEDVTILLKDVTGLVEPQSTEEREKLIQSGRHYCEMLPIEYRPSEKYLELFEYALKEFSSVTADAVGRMSERIYTACKAPVLVSLARAGIPAGIMSKHYLEKKNGIDVPHYSISIIRGRGIDKNALDYILSEHPAENIRFVDGWTGKGAINRQLYAALSEEKYKAIDPTLAVIADPAHLTRLCGTHDDFLIASSCLNSTVSGLVSRTFLRDDIIGKSDFHGAVYYGELIKEDLSYRFIEETERHFDMSLSCGEDTESICALDDINPDVLNVGRDFGIDDINLIKPGIGEATRVLLRRIPYRILIAEECEEKYISHILQLAKEKNVAVEKYPLKNYRCCGIIKQMSDV